MSNNLDMRSVRAIFVTHEHTDHCQGLRVLASRYGITVYSSAGTMAELEKAGRIDSRFNTDIIESKVSLGDMLVERVDTPHDAQESCGYRVTTADGKKVIVATDMGIMLPSVRNAIAECDAAVVESNHDVNMLMSGAYPYVLKRRILSDRGHLSNMACAQELPFFVNSGVKHLILGHLSSENNTPDVAFQTSLCSLLQAGMKEGEDFTLQVAPKETNGKAVIF